MSITVKITLRAALLAGAAFTISGCLEDTGLDRFGGGNRNDTQAAYVPPPPDDRGVITYKTYQVAVAERNDTVRRMADRFGQSVDELSRVNGIHPDASLRAGEVIVLPRGVDGAAIVDGRLVAGGDPVRRPGEVDIETIASDAIEAADGGGVASPDVTTRPSDEPLRHRVVKGETASGIAQQYNVSVRAIADWNGLGPDNSVRIGQSLLIPPPNSTANPVLQPVEEPKEVTKPGVGTATPKPPSAEKPLPKPAKPEPKPEPEPKEEPADAGARLTMPVKGSVIQDFKPGKMDGIVISASAGSPVVAAESGRVGSILVDTNGIQILVLRHAGGLNTVYAGIDGITVKIGDSVGRGQKFATVAAGSPSFLRFETRNGFEAVDPMNYLN